ncbi:54S ribosomal protein L25, mitochondrial [Cytospora mali]|uniref:54S ribosomal protein L25, mitochondrial n=1 Tax=Cytospora mali TaxID=578113 RepID=A0A194UXY5_CYTMA|nr:54S ribosomal protein L25, mitochondrial [Valsa mali var. pyri (nom. inval.)]
MASTATTTASHYISLAKTLPPKLQRFFARYPSSQILEPLPSGAFPRTGYQADRRNPFQPKKHPKTGRTHDPVYSLRRQADLVKAARNYGVEELLPYTPKKTEEQLKHRVQYGLRVKGTGVDQKVKGKIFERQMAVKMEKRREAMLKMPALIREWKAVGRKNWTKWPK